MKNRLVELLKAADEYSAQRCITDYNEAIADNAEYLLANGVIAPRKAVDGDFKFEYGIVVFKHRFSINRSLDDYEETTLNKCIRMGIEYKYYTVACDKLIAELQITYKDEENKLHCLKKDLHDWTFEIKHKGDMRISL